MLNGLLDSENMSTMILPIVAGLLVGGYWFNKTSTPAEEPEEDEEVKEAHVEPQRQAAIARDWGTVPRVSTQRNILAGQAIGQTIDYTLPVGQSPQGNDPINSDWTAYSYTLMTTEPIFGQNYFGRAVGVV
jgi:hypothetical protein